MKAMLKSWSVLIVAMLMALSLIACGSAEDAAPNSAPSETPAQQEKPAEQPAEEQGALKTQYPLTVKDATGTEVTFEKAPTRIVSLAPSETEKLFALGLDEEIVGVSDLDDYPEAAKSKPKMGGFQVNEEAVIAAEADVVFSASMNAENAEKLRGMGVKLFVNDPSTIEEVMSSITLVGQITDRQEEAQTVVEQMRQELASVTEAVKSVKEEDKKKVYVEFSPGWTVGSGTFLDELVTLAGGVNIMNDREGWFEVDPEAVIARNPQVIIHPRIEGVDFAGDMLSRPGWDRIDAVRNNRVVAVANEPLVRVGPRLTDGLLEIAAALHPERFP